MMNEIDPIIVKVISGIATPEEMALLDAWLNSDATHLSEFTKLKSYWASQVHKNQEITADEAFERFTNTRLQPKKRINKTIQFYLLGIASVAAVVALFLISRSVSMVSPDRNITFSTQNKIDTLILPDSSMVVLNKNSRLDYTSAYNNKERHVKLAGEAYFDVRKNPKSPFIVEMNKSRITVLGTAFNVRAYHNDDYVRATLVRGSIRFNIDNDQVTLRPNQNLNYNKLNDEISINSVDLESTMLWLKDVYRFQSTPLEQLLNDLGLVFDKKIEIANSKLARTVISGSFSKNQSLEDILKIISTSVPIKWEFNSDTVIINY